MGRDSTLSSRSSVVSLQLDELDPISFIDQAQFSRSRRPSAAFLRIETQSNEIPKGQYLQAVLGVAKVLHPQSNSKVALDQQFPDDASMSTPTSERDLPTPISAVLPARSTSRMKGVVPPRTPLSAALGSPLKLATDLKTPSSVTVPARSSSRRNDTATSPMAISPVRMARGDSLASNASTCSASSVRIPSREVSLPVASLEHLKIPLRSSSNNRINIRDDYDEVAELVNSVVSSSNFRAPSPL
ncbi:hypothetical protein BC830DRAFT_1168272 [Chytriomyces sp. MP71]|nr:hypothetical protein BC830DRAFT_1168272 [Chytriomyces sp. MP71]